MATSQDLMNQLQQYSSGNIPGEIETAIKKAYEPTVTSLIQQGGELRPAAYSGFFNEAQKYGTGAGDLSPSARLSAMISGGERAMNPYRTNLDIRNYYGTSINDLVNKGLQAYQTGYGQLKDLYGMRYQTERDAAEDAFRQQQLGEQRSARAAQESAAAQQAKIMRDYYDRVYGAGGLPGGAGTGDFAIDIPDRPTIDNSAATSVNSYLNPITAVPGYVAARQGQNDPTWQPGGRKYEATNWMTKIPGIGKYF